MSDTKMPSMPAMSTSSDPERWERAQRLAIEVWRLIEMKADESGAVDALLTFATQEAQQENEACAEIADGIEGGDGCGEYSSCPLEIAERIRARAPYDGPKE